MSEFARAHAALFDELERQGIYCADVVKLTQAVVEAQAIIARPLTNAACSVERVEPFQRCEICE